MFKKLWRGFIGTLGCLVGLHRWEYDVLPHFFGPGENGHRIVRVCNLCRVEQHWYGIMRCWSENQANAQISGGTPSAEAGCSAIPTKGE